MPGRVGTLAGIVGHRHAVKSELAWILSPFEITVPSQGHIGPTALPPACPVSIAPYSQPMEDPVSKKCREE